MGVCFIDCCAVYSLMTNFNLKGRISVRDDNVLRIGTREFEREVIERDWFKCVRVMINSQLIVFGAVTLNFGRFATVCVGRCNITMELLQIPAFEITEVKFEDVNSCDLIPDKFPFQPNSEYFGVIGDWWYDRDLNKSRQCEILRSYEWNTESKMS